ncbi:MAG: type III pantothenate kinase [Chitinophagales bacterium]
MNLCIDIGNTKSKIGLFEDDQLVRSYSRKNISATWLSELLQANSIAAAIVSNTRDRHLSLRKELESLPFYIDLDHHTRLPIQNHYATPETLGRDRLAVVCAASGLYPKQNVLIIDAGTCITLDAVSKEGDYYGGSIHPGLTMRYKALNNYTGKLPFVKKQVMNELVGNSTENAILAGVSYAIIKEMDGMIDDYKVKYGELKVIITGGDASFFVSQLKSQIFAHSNLVLAGLNKILKYNVESL